MQTRLEGYIYIYIMYIYFIYILYIYNIYIIYIHICIYQIIHYVHDTRKTHYKICTAAQIQILN